MGILDGIVDWLATQVMNLLDLASTSVLGALGCNMDTFKRYFPAASAMYEIFIWTAIGLVLLNLVWQLYRCYGAGFDIDTENPINLVVRSIIFLLLIWYCDDIVNLALQIGGTPYNWILDSRLSGVQFGDFNSVLLVIIGVIANGSVALIALILVVVLAWNYLKLLLEAAERYIVLGILVFTAPLAFAMGAARGTNNIFKSWCRMFGGQLLSSANARMSAFPARIPPTTMAWTLPIPTAHQYWRWRPAQSLKRGIMSVMAIIWSSITAAGTVRFMPIAASFWHRLAIR